jgi:formimidoylglutamate deiminase
MSQALAFQYLLTPRGIARDTRIRIDESGRITSLEPVQRGPYDGFFALPGMPNSHSHAFQRALAGQGETRVGADSFWSWREAMYALANRITAKEMRAIAAQAFADMLRGGFTSVAEFHYLHHLPSGRPSPAMAQAVLDAADEVGIRMVLLPVFYVTGGFARAGSELSAREEQRRFVHRDIDAFCRLLEQVADRPCGLAPHSLRAVPPRLLHPLIEAASSVLGDGFPIHMHIAEQPREVEDCRNAFGLTPVDLLAETVSLNDRWNLVHATHVSRSELETMARIGVGAVLCPLTEAYLGDGIFPAADFVRQRGRIAIGSDSNARIDAVEELRLLEYGQRLSDGMRARLANEEGIGAPIWRLTANAGARALAQPVGAIERGCFADLVVLDENHPALLGVAPERMLDALITGGDARCIRDVYVGGRRLVQNGRVTNGRRIGSRFARTMRALWPTALESAA